MQPDEGGTNPRGAALRGMLWSVPLAALTLLTAYALSRDARSEGALKLFGQLSPVLLVPLLVHATQLVTSVSFGELAARWDELAGWQRGVLGLAVVLLAGGAILWLAFAVAMHLEAIPSGG